MENKLLRFILAGLIYFILYQNIPAQKNHQFDDLACSFWPIDNSTRKNIKNFQCHAEIKVVYYDCVWDGYLYQGFTDSYSETISCTTSFYQLWVRSKRYDKCKEYSILYYTLTFSAPGYDEKVITQNMGGDAWTAFKKDQKLVYLNPLKKEILVEGNLNLSTKNLNDIPDILSVEEVAAFLKVNKSDVMDLIEKKELKAKKVGDKYIITKKELIKFLEK